MTARTTPRTRKMTLVLAGALAALGLTAIGAVLWDGTTDRERVVAERGAEVMPFDLNATTHTFDLKADGGVQTVTADDPSDQDQIGLIRQHLREEATAFKKGDFGDPAQIHGDEMPGLATLEASAGQITINYANVDAGAKVRFTTDNPELTTALHDWFAAQTSDHGEHAD